jgi:hypothetical protein
MATLTQGIESLEFLLSEGNGKRAREQVTVTIAGSVALPSGTVLGKITASGKYIKQADGASDGSQVAAGVLGYAIAGVNGDYPKQLIFDADCEVIGDRLNGGAGPSATAKAALIARGIKVR